jgi:hypothetical protein
MMLRKMLLVCVLVAAAILPLVGCKGSTDKKPAGGGAAPAKTSTNTTAE